MLLREVNPPAVYSVRVENQTQKGFISTNNALKRSGVRRRSHDLAAIGILALVLRSAQVSRPRRQWDTAALGAGLTTSPPPVKFEETWRSECRAGSGDPRTAQAANGMPH